MSYVDGYVIPIKKKNIKAYRKMATLGCKIWMEHGALDYYECIGDDFAKWGWGFPKMCKLKTGETVIFAFIVYKSKVHRNKINAKVMKDPRMKMDGVTMPFDMKRFSMAGFKTVVQAK
ncbi:MAG: DUF1428 domain-containing protein [Bdellovibrionota bacterium]